MKQGLGGKGDRIKMDIEDRMIVGKKRNKKPILVGKNALVNCEALNCFSLLLFLY